MIFNFLQWIFPLKCQNCSYKWYFRHSLIILVVVSVDGWAENNIFPVYKRLPIMHQPTYILTFLYFILVYESTTLLLDKVQFIRKKKWWRGKRLDANFIIFMGCLGFCFPLRTQRHMRKKIIWIWLGLMYWCICYLMSATLLLRYEKNSFHSKSIWSSIKIIWYQKIKD